MRNFIRKFGRGWMATGRAGARAVVFVLVSLMYFVIIPAFALGFALRGIGKRSATNSSWSSREDKQPDLADSMQPY